MPTIHYGGAREGQWGIFPHDGQILVKPKKKKKQTNKQNKQTVICL